MKPIAPIMKEIRRLADAQRQRAPAVATAAPTPSDPSLDLQRPMRMPDDQRLAGLVGFLDRFRRRALHAILVQQTQVNRDLVTSADQLAAALAGVTQERQDLEDRLETAQLEIAHLRAAVRALQTPDQRTAGAALMPEGMQAYHRDPISFTLEDALRGDEDLIRQRQQVHVDRFRTPAGEPPAEVLDVACGRGEFLELMRGAGISARGVDASPGNVSRCREKQLDVVNGDALVYVSQLIPQSLTGIFAAHFIEHVPPDYLLAFLRAAFAALRIGGCLVLETVNIDSLATLTTFHADPSHITPLPANTMRLLLTAVGFQHIEIEYLAPYPTETKLPLLPNDDGGARVNESLMRLNQLLFAPREYAAVAIR
jgi:2-polyprenyl-3-methyl-5-hydroxy-6-metoxy-1,4-benzoquinol methylase